MPHHQYNMDTPKSGSDFKLESPFQPNGDQPAAIKQLCEGLENSERTQTLLGATGTGKTFTMANVIQKQDALPDHGT